MPAVLFVGAGRHQRRAIRRLRELGCRVVAVDRDAQAPGLAEADAHEVVDFANAAAVADAGRRHAVDGVLTAFSDRAVPVVAAVAEELGLPGIGRTTARAATNKLAMRRRLAAAGIPQPPFAAVRGADDADALDRVGLPAVLKPADSAGQRGVFCIRSRSELAERLPQTLAESPSGEAIVERFHHGLEVNALLVACAGEPRLLTLSDRLRPDGASPGFGVALAHVFPSSLAGPARAEAERVAAETVRAVGLRDGVAYPQLLVTAAGDALVLEVAARVPAGQMDEVARLGVGVDLIEVALRQSLGQPVDALLARARAPQPLAVFFLTAEPGPLQPGVVRRLNGLERVRTLPGVVGAEVYLHPGDTVRPVRVDGDRKGFVIATANTADEALERARTAAAAIEVEVA